jgi:hypothetical protein
LLCIAPGRIMEAIMAIGATVRKTLPFLLLGLGALPLGACVDDYAYGARVSYGPGPYAYNGWYDGYYGSIYDGYWGNDGYFYYRRGGGRGPIPGVIGAISCARRRAGRTISSPSMAP